MSASMSPLAPLAWVGRHARWALPLGVFAGIVFPALAALMRPLIEAAVVGTFTGALLRLDWSALARVARAPASSLWLASWLLVGTPLVVWGATSIAGMSAELQRALVLQAAAPPIGSAAVFAMFVGLSGALSVAGTVLTTLALPVTLTALVALLLPEAGLQVDLAAFFLRASGFVAAPFMIAWGLRRALGAGWLARNDELLAGVNVVVLVVFAIAVMDGVTARMLRDPGWVALLLALACGATLVFHLAGYALQRSRGVEQAYEAALIFGNRNMGLMLAITAGTAGEAFSLYVGIAQIPMYFAPLLLTPLLRRARRR
ncbi:MAG: hypothetical protein KJZ83_21995 [Burkholderiaceae bacterium]|nr:hypothetical protein [Burkholderiaceae bacterium]